MVSALYLQNDTSKRQKTVQHLDNALRATVSLKGKLYPQRPAFWQRLLCFFLKSLRNQNFPYSSDVLSLSLSLSLPSLSLPLSLSPPSSLSPLSLSLSLSLSSLSLSDCLSSFSLWMQSRRQSVGRRLQPCEFFSIKLLIIQRPVKVQLIKPQKERRGWLCPPLPPPPPGKFVKFTRSGLC